MIETASLVIPSPNTMLNKFGYLLKLIRDIAATTSLEQSKLHISKDSYAVSSKSSETYSC